MRKSRRKPRARSEPNETASTEMFGTRTAANAARASRSALSQIETVSPKDAAAWPAAIDPTMNAADPLPRTQPYSNLLPTAESDADSVIASAIGARGASKTDCMKLTSRIAPKHRADTYASAATPAPAAQMDNVPRHIR